MFLQSSFLQALISQTFWKHLSLRQLYEASSKMKEYLFFPYERVAKRGVLPFYVILVIVFSLYSVSVPFYFWGNSSPQLSPPWRVFQTQHYRQLWNGEIFSVYVKIVPQGVKTNWELLEIKGACRQCPDKGIFF